MEETIRQEIERLDAQDALVKEIAKLVEAEIAKDPALAYEDGLKKVLNENPYVSNKLNDIAAHKKTFEVLKMDSGEVIDDLIRIKRGEKASLSFSEAFSEVQLEYPDITRDYLTKL